MAQDPTVTSGALKIQLGFNKKVQIIHSPGSIEKLRNSLSHFGCPLIPAPGNENIIEQLSEKEAKLRLDSNVHTKFYTLFNIPKPAHIPESEHIEKLIFNNEDLYHFYSTTLKEAGITVIAQGSTPAGTDQSKSFYINISKEDYKHIDTLDFYFRNRVSAETLLRRHTDFEKMYTEFGQKYGAILLHENYQRELEAFQDIHVGKFTFEEKIKKLIALAKTKLGVDDSKSTKKGMFSGAFDAIKSVDTKFKHSTKGYEMLQYLVGLETSVNAIGYNNPKIIIPKAPSSAKGVGADATTTANYVSAFSGASKTPRASEESSRALSDDESSKPVVDNDSPRKNQQNPTTGKIMVPPPVETLNIVSSSSELSSQFESDSSSSYDLSDFPTIDGVPLMPPCVTLGYTATNPMPLGAEYYIDLLSQSESSNFNEKGSSDGAFGSVFQHHFSNTTVPHITSFPSNQTQPLLYPTTNGGSVTPEFSQSFDEESNDLTSNDVIESGNQQFSPRGNNKEQ